jgi:hypothetical protein
MKASLDRRYSTMASQVVAPLITAHGEAETSARRWSLFSVSRGGAGSSAEVRKFSEACP